MGELRSGRTVDDGTVAHVAADADAASAATGTGTGTGTGGAGIEPRVRIQEADFDVAAELAAMQHGRTDIGAVASFVGCVRGHTPDDAISALTLEHYPGMTDRKSVV